MSTAEHKENSALPGVGTTADAWFDEAAAHVFEAAAERVRASWDDVEFETKGDEGLLPPEPWLPPTTSNSESSAFTHTAPAVATSVAPAADVVGQHAPIALPFSQFERLPTQRTQPSVAARLQALSREKRWLVPAVALSSVLFLVLVWPRRDPTADQVGTDAPRGSTAAIEAVSVENDPPAAAAPARREPLPTASSVGARPAPTTVVEPIGPGTAAEAEPKATRERSPEHRRVERAAAVRENRSQRVSAEAAPRKRPVRETAAARPSRSKAKAESAAFSAPPDRPQEAPKPRKGTGFVSANPY